MLPPPQPWLGPMGRQTHHGPVLGGDGVEGFGVNWSIFGGCTWCYWGGYKRGPGWRWGSQVEFGSQVEVGGLDGDEGSWKDLGV